MRAAILDRPKKPLRIVDDAPRPASGATDIVIQVRACGVCRTDLHIVDGELSNPKLPLVLGHQIAGVVIEVGASARRFHPGDRVGVGWLGWTDGTCRYCRSGRENLCDAARFTGYDRDGGYAQYAAADERFCFPLPAGFDDVHAAPLLCAGLIGYRTLKLAGEAESVGIYGFGSSAHLVAQIAVARGQRVYAFSREGDTKTQEFARRLGAEWAGGSTDMPPQPLDAALIFAPAGELVPQALRAVAKGGTVVCGGIHMSDIPSFPYSMLWEERSVRSVANLTRKDGEELFDLVSRNPLTVKVTTFELERANQALEALRSGAVRGSIVLTMPSD